MLRKTPWLVKLDKEICIKKTISLLALAFLLAAAFAEPVPRMLRLASGLVFFLFLLATEFQKQD